MSNIRLKDLDFSYGKEKILGPLNIELQGQIIGIFGWNGCGKSTLLKLICGILQPKQGKILYPSGFSKEDLAFMPQKDVLFPKMTVLENLLLWTDEKEESLISNIKAGYLSQLNLFDFINKKTSTLSGGMRKRVSLATVLLQKPKIILLDEPFSELDLKHRKWLKDFIYDFSKFGKVLITSHDGEGFSTCDKRYGIIKGKIYELRSQRFEELEEEIEFIEEDNKNER